MILSYFVSVFRGEGRVDTELLASLIRNGDGREDGMGEERCKGERRRPLLEYVTGR
jgi:hypothetical protein